jgi:hypothetical protein
VLLLEKTKSGRRREVPMNDAAYAVLSKRSDPRAGRVFLNRSIRKAFEKATRDANWRTSGSTTCATRRPATS